MTTRSVLEREFTEIRDNLLRMSDLVDQAIEKSVQSLQDLDVDRAQEVVDGDVQINALADAVEEECVAIIATQQPAAGDLRAVISAIHLVTEMERMGDHATGIAKTVPRMLDATLVNTPDKILDMAQMVRGMLQQAIEAYIERDPQKARAAAAGDDKVDALYNQFFRDMLKEMVRHAEATECVTYLLWSGHNLERIGDRVTNIAERVIFMTTGENLDLNV